MILSEPFSKKIHWLRKYERVILEALIILDLKTAESLFALISLLNHRKQSQGNFYLVRWFTLTILKQKQTDFSFVLFQFQIYTVNFIFDQPCLNRSILLNSSREKKTLFSLTKRRKQSETTNNSQWLRHNLKRYFFTENIKQKTELLKQKPWGSK